MMKKHRVIYALLIFVLLGISIVLGIEKSVRNKMTTEPQEIAIFAGGCFWCMQPVYDDIKGVLSTRVGYIGGKVPNPTYEQVSMGNTGHAEAIEVKFDPTEVSYEKLLDLFWINIDPTVLNRQFADKGTQYRTAIFYTSEEQKKSALKSKDALEQSKKYDKPIVTEITAATTFYPAEDYHQAYYSKNPIHYNFYKKASGREDYIKRNKGK